MNTCDFVDQMTIYANVIEKSKRLSDKKKVKLLDKLIEWNQNFLEVGI